MNVIPGAAHSELKMLGKQTCNDTDSGGHEPYNPTKVARSWAYEATENCRVTDLRGTGKLQVP